MFGENKGKPDVGILYFDGKRRIMIHVIDHMVY
jgi:hypothetical protein